MIFLDSTKKELKPFIKSVLGLDENCLIYSVIGNGWDQLIDKLALEYAIDYHRMSMIASFAEGIGGCNVSNVFILADSKYKKSKDSNIETKVVCIKNLIKKSNFAVSFKNFKVRTKINCSTNLD